MHDIGMALPKGIFPIDIHSANVPHRYGCYALPRLKCY